MKTKQNNTTTVLGTDNEDPSHPQSMGNEHSLPAPRITNGRPCPTKRMSREALLPPRINANRFTLAEQLVVIGILAAMLLPALNMARKKTHYINWRGYSEDFRKCAGNVAYYTFETDDGDTVTNQAVGPYGEFNGRCTVLQKSRPADGPARTV